MRLRFGFGFAMIVFASSATAGTMQPVANFGANPGALAMYEYVPDGLPPGRPLVVVLHGCTQTASAMEAAGWNTLADAHDFAVIYPEQSTGNNPVRCFNWAGEYGDTANLERAKGENQSIISMIDSAIATHGSDPDRVYVVGFSAGAAFAAVMIATWPERFAGASIMSGVAYRCATSVNGAFSCQNPGVSKSAQQWGDLVRVASTGPYPPVQLWQGATDTTVVPANLAELVKQWTNVLGADATAASEETLGKATRRLYRRGNEVAVESWTVASMGHAIAIGGEGCPSKIAAYFSDQSTCATQRAAEFFGLTGGGGTDDDNGNGSGGGSNDGGNNDDPSNTNKLPGCGLDASGGGTGFAALALVVLAILRRR